MSRSSIYQAHQPNVAESDPGNCSIDSDLLCYFKTAAHPLAVIIYRTRLRMAQFEP